MSSTLIYIKKDPHFCQYPLIPNMGIRAVMWQFCTRWVSEGIFGRHISQRQCIWSSNFFGFMYIAYFMLAILPTIIGGYPRCGLCIANNGVANCIELVAAPCIRILNHGAEDVRDIFVGRCGQKVDPAKMAILTKFNGKRCNSKYCTALYPKNLYLMVYDYRYWKKKNV